MALSTSIFCCYAPAYQGEQHPSHLQCITSPAVSVVAIGEPSSAESAIDYWEEISAEDGSIWFYNHTTQEYSEALPTALTTIEPGDENARTTENNTGLTMEPISEVDELQQDISAGSGRTLPNSSEGNHGLEEGMEIWEDEAEGEVFVPWAVDDPGDMKATLPTATVVAELPGLPECWLHTAPILFLSRCICSFLLVGLVKHRPWAE